MDCLKGISGGWHSWRPQVKKAVVTMAVIVAAGALYLQLRKDYRLNDKINNELQRDYGMGGARLNDPEMLRDYNSFDHVYQSSDVADVQRNDKSAEQIDSNHALDPAVNFTGKEQTISGQELIIKGTGDVQHDQAMDVAHDDGEHGSTERPIGFSLGPSLSPAMGSEARGKDEILTAPSVPPPASQNLTTHSSLSQLHNMAPSPSNIHRSHGNSKDDLMTDSPSSTPPIPLSVKPNTADKEDELTQSPSWPLSKLELELFAAKEAILNVPPSNSSLYHKELHAPIYHNLSRFIKSYELMEQMFRVYVYKEGRQPLVHTGPVYGIYSSEGLFIRQMEQSRQFRTDVVYAALAVFLPYSVANMVDELYVPHSTSMLPLSSFIKAYVNEVAAVHSFWNRTGGGDHFFVSCHDWGLMTTYEHAELRRNAIKVLCNADTTTEFDKGRDRSLPEFYMHETDKLVGEGESQEEGETSSHGGGGQPRDTLAFFAGRMHGRVRPELLQHWEYPKGGEEMQVYGVLPASDARRMSYKQRMRASRYCLCPMGYEVNSPRLVEAIEAMCVPVIIADGFVLPFSQVLDWSSFSVTVPEKDIAALKSILQGIPDHVYAAMRSRLAYVRRHFTWHQDPKPYDTFHMILHSVWASRLANITSLHI